jgi:hypothetical protein
MVATTLHVPALVADKTLPLMVQPAAPDEETE